MPFYSPPLNTSTITRQVQDEKTWDSLLQRYAAKITGNLECPVELDPILSLITSARDIRQCLNFEQLIEMVDKFSSFSLDGFPLPKGGIETLPKHQHLVFRFLNAKQPSQHGQYWQMVPFLFRQIIAETIENWDSDSRSAAYDDLVFRQSELLASLLEQGDLSVYSFNYDDVLPQTLIASGRPLLETGFHSGRFDSERFLKASSIIAFVHGHARWTWDDCGMRCFNSTTDANRWRLDHLFNLEVGETMELIGDSPRAYDFNTFLTTGLDKEPSFSRKPYSAYYHRMASELMCANSVIIIGYSLNDPHIDRLLMNYLEIRRKTNKVLVVGRWKHDINPMQAYLSVGNTLQRYLKGLDIEGIPVTRSLKLSSEWVNRLERTNSIGYGFVHPQMWIYKNGYGRFLSEWQTVLNEWRSSHDP